MDSEEFISNLFCDDYYLSFFFSWLFVNNVNENCQDLYHVIVHVSAFETFLNSYKSTIVPFEYFSSTDHVHLIIYSRNSIMARGICSKRFTQSSEITFNFCKNSHDAICKVLFTVPTLEITCMKTILNNLYGHVSNLKLPKLIIRKIFEFSKSYKNFPYFNGQNFIGSVQSPLSKLEFVNETISVVCFHFRDNFHNNFNLCQNCMTIEVEDESKKRYNHVFFQRIRRKCSGRWKNIVGNYLFWCQSCKNIPLFEMLTDEIVNQFETVVERGYGYEIVKKPQFIDYFTDGKMNHSIKVFERFYRRVA